MSEPSTPATATSTPLFRRGDRGRAVREIRSRLDLLGLTSSVDGTGDRPGDADTFDDDLDHAVRAFQQQRGLSVDGIVGLGTYRVLEEARWRLGDRLLTT